MQATEMKGKENFAGPANARATEDLASLLHQGSKLIQTHQTKDLFKQLETRSLTEDEESVIQQRVALQRKMFAEYERRDRARKVTEIIGVCPHVTIEEAAKALDLSNGREDQATDRLVTDPDFLQLVRLELAGPTAALPRQSSGPTRTRKASANKHYWAAQPGAAPSTVDSSSLSDAVFVGGFRGRGWPIAARGQSVPRVQVTRRLRQGQAEAGTPTGAEPEGNSSGDLDADPALAAAGLESEPEDATVVEDRSAPSRDNAAVQHEDREDDIAISSSDEDQTEMKDDCQDDPLHEATAADERVGPTRQAALEGDVSMLDQDGGNDAQDKVPVKGKRSKRPRAVANKDTPARVWGAGMLDKPPNSSASEQMQQDRGAGPASSSDQPSTRELNGADAELPSRHRRSNPAQPSASHQGKQAGVLEPPVTDDSTVTDNAEVSQKQKKIKVANGTQAQRHPGRAFKTCKLKGQPSRQRSVKDMFNGPLSKRPNQAQPKAAEETAGNADADEGAFGAALAYPGSPAGPEAPIDMSGTDTDTHDAEQSPVRHEAASDPEFSPRKAAGGGKRPPKRQRTSTRAELKLSQPKRAANNACKRTKLQPASDEACPPETHTPSEEGVGPDVPLGRVQRIKPAKGAKGSKKERAAQTESEDGKGCPAELPEAIPEAANPEGAPGSSAQPDEQGAAAGLAGQASLGSESLPSSADDSPQAQAEAATIKKSPEVEANGGEPKAKGGGRRHAISRNGHTVRGRVRQKGSRQAELLEAGTLRVDKGWYNSGYVFPDGFKSRVLFRSSVALERTCLHECFVLGKSGAYFPLPTFQVTALDRPEEPVIAKSCTGCWTQIQKRINAVIESRRKAGEDLPPAPKTAIAGPEFFGFNQPEIESAIEALDPEHLCQEFWCGKEDRDAARQGQPPPSAASDSGSAPSAGPRKARKPRRPRGMRAGSNDDDEEPEAGAAAGGPEEEDETTNMTNKWSAVSRSERYKKRCAADGDESGMVDDSNPLPDFIDPITLDPVIAPAISPYGHVMGIATWKAVLAEHQHCPFTKNPLSWEQCKVLTKHNIDRYQDRIKL
ncbi:hypothetical protein WJX74_003803 [Apatococcus lobatus]|uniref:Uncharacterized protein n=1 Tax=Apatococcus lobatus TaxID=904363 RepID=A0AAW1RQE4_9CHLO